MTKRLGVFLGIAAVSVVAVVGVFAGVIVAQSDDEGGGKGSFAERVASILGLGTEEVENAFTRARDEMMDERLDGYLVKLVDDGRLTQEEVDAILAWRDAMPNVELMMSGKGRWGSRGFGRSLGLEVLSGDKLSYLVDEGFLSRADADELLGWYDERPDALSKLMPRGGRWGKHEGRWHHGKKSRWGEKWGEWSGKDKGEDM